MGARSLAARNRFLAGHLEAIVPISPTLPVLEQACCHCGHVSDVHDPVATRYCAATLSNSLPRTCVCAVGPPVAARSYDRR